MILTHDNITQHVDEWALDYGVPAKLIMLRIAAGWTTGDAIETEMPTKVRALKLHRRELRAAAKARKEASRLTPKPRKPSRQTFLTHNGETLSVRQWSDRLGIARHTIHSRLKLGLTVDRVLTPGDLRLNLRGTEPINFLTYEGQTRSLAEWSRITGINAATIRHRQCRGLSSERILDPRLNVRLDKPKPTRRSFYITAQGQRLTLAEWSRRTGIDRATIRARILQQGMSGDEAVTKPVRAGGRTPAIKDRGVGRAQAVNAGTGAHPTAQISG